MEAPERPKLHSIEVTSLESTNTHRADVRVLIAANAVLWALIALGLYVESPLTTWIWPWDDSRMTYIFLASIAAAVAAPLAWIAIVDEPAALAGINIDGVVIGTLISAAMAVMAISGSEWRLFVFAAGAAILTIVAGYLFRHFHAVAVRDLTSQPNAVRVAFFIFVAVLVPLGIALMLRVDGVFPWTLPDHTSTMIGAMFVGASAYFAYGIWRNSWVHSGGQLAGFLAYDLVLAIPYWRTVFDRNAMSGSGGYQSFPGQVLPNESDAVNDNSLYIYTAVITISGLVAIYYLFLCQKTRMFRRPKQFA